MLVQLNLIISWLVYLKLAKKSHLILIPIVELFNIFSINFFLAFLTHVLVRFLKHVSFNEGIESLVEIFLVHDRDADVEEVFSSDVAVRTSFADDFVCESAPEMILNCLRLRSTFDCRL